MNRRPEIWLLARGERLVAELELQTVDDPWRHGRVVRREGFAELAGPFELEERLAAELPRAPLRWLRAYRRLRAEIRLIGPDGHEVPDFLLHIEGTRASWRKLDATADAPDFERRLRAALREGQPLTLPDFGTVGFTGASAAVRGERSAPVSDSRVAITELTLEGGLP